MLIFLKTNYELQVVEISDRKYFQFLKEWFTLNIEWAIPDNAHQFSVAVHIPIFGHMQGTCRQVTLVAIPTTTYFQMSPASRF